MISEEQDHRGNLIKGEMLCDGCQRVLCSYWSQEEAPPLDRDGYWAFVTDCRVVIRGRTNDRMMKELGLMIMFTFDDHAKGYRPYANRGPLLLDCCSDECAMRWFREHDDYALLVSYSASSGQFGLISDKPWKFRTETVDGFLSSGTLRQDTAGSLTGWQSQEISILGRKYAVKRPSIAPAEGGIGPLGIALDTLIVKCPMLVGEEQSGYRRCDHWLQLIAEFTPSAWICPHCHGLIMLDKTAKASSYAAADLQAVLPKPELSLFLHSGIRLDWEDESTLSWVQSKIGLLKPFYAEGFTEEAQMDAWLGANNVVLAPAHTELEKVVRYFGYLME